MRGEINRERRPNQDETEKINWKNMTLPGRYREGERQERKCHRGNQKPYLVAKNQRDVNYVGSEGLRALISSRRSSKTSQFHMPSPKNTNRSIDERVRSIPARRSGARKTGSQVRGDRGKHQTKKNKEGGGKLTRSSETESTRKKIGTKKKGEGKIATYSELQRLMRFRHYCWQNSTKVDCRKKDGSGDNRYCRCEGTKKGPGVH